MQRVAIKARSDWRARVEAIGFDFHTIDDAPYWIEDAWYHFSAAEIDRIEDASNELHALCIDAVERIVRAGDYSDYDLDDAAKQMIERSWRQRNPAIYGRMDLSLGADGTPKLLEYNADTPTALFEAAVVQWQWFEQVRPAADQFNSIHERLIEAWREMRAQSPTNLLHFAGCLDLPEDRTTLEYLADTAMQAGFDARLLAMQDVGLARGRFVDLAGDEIRTMFKLYPWEWMLAEAFASALPQSATRWIEPAWKLLLSDKAILAKLWSLHPRHPNLLPASFDANAIAEFDLVRKPCRDAITRNTSRFVPHAFD